MNIVIAGASGLIGTALSETLRGDGHRVHVLVRRAPRSDAEIAWNPAAGELDSARLEGTDAFINLAGANVGDARWTQRRRAEIRESRLSSTRTLVAAIAALRRKPAVLVNASAVGVYGDCGDKTLSETAPVGAGFLAGVCVAWEREATVAAQAGVRTVLLRFGVVLARDGGALAKMLPLFRAGLGGRIGSGRQWMSWISLADAIGVVRHVLAHREVSGPINVVAPEPVTNSEFSAALGRVLGRPAALPVPALMLRLAVGQGMADEALLASPRALPDQLVRSGYRFAHPTLESALRALQL